MPFDGFGNYQPSATVRALRDAWRKHYVAKGCNAEKAYWLAHKKTHTWPPTS